MPEKRYIKQLNGYYVKDEEARNAIDEASEAIAKANETLDVIFPTYGADGEDTLGDCTILKSKTKTMMIDTFTGIIPETYQAIVAALEAQHIEKLDYLLITHYHGDHTGNIQNLINGGYLAGATVYLPRKCSRYPEYNQAADDFADALTAAGATVITVNNQTIMLDGVKVELFNGSAEDYAYYDSYEEDASYTDVQISYNDYSVYANVTLGNTKMLFTGDADRVANEYVQDKYLLSNYDLLKDGHHGFIRFDAAYAKKVNPKYVVVPASKGMVNLNLARWATAVSHWAVTNSKVYVQGYQKEPIVIKATTNGLNVDTESYSVEEFAGGAGVAQYYVDSTTTNELRTGSREYPFKTLSEASMLMPKTSSNSIRLNVISLDPDGNPVYFEGYKRLHVKFNDQAYANTIEFRRCHFAQIEGANMTSGQLIIRESKANVTKFTSTADHAKPLEITQSEVIIEGAISIAVKQNESAITVSRDSSLYFAPSSMSFTFPESGSGHIFNGWGSTIMFPTSAITALKTYPFLTRITGLGSAKQLTFSENYKELLELFSSNSPAYTDIVAKENVRLYPYCEILVSNNNDVEALKIKSDKIANPKFTFQSADGTEIYVQSCIISTTNDPTLTVSRNGETTIKSDGTVTISQSNKIGVLKIRGVIE